MYALVRRAIWLASFALFAANAHAITLDWDTAAWTNGATSGTPTAGVDVNIAPSTPGILQPSLVSPFPQTPAITRAFDGGLTPGENTLELAIDLPNNGNANFVTITITFSATTYVNGVDNVSFALFDIDAANVSGSTYQDRVFNISATTTSGGTVAPTISNLGSAVTDTAGVLTGNASVLDTGAGSGDGNATISFSGNAIRSITFSYGSGMLYANPTYQHIGLYDVTFTPVPEVNPAIAAAFSCLAAMLLIRYHNGRMRK
jgi:hypothetical protein